MLPKVLKKTDVWPVPIGALRFEIPDYLPQVILLLDETTI